MTVLIPAYEPDIKLIKLITKLKEHCDYNIIVIDDGSGTAFNYIFNKAKSLGCKILTHEKNRGKGRALKTGFKYIISETNEKTGVVTADADGQHKLIDIIKIADEISYSKDKIVLGARKFVGYVPLRSIIGNIFMRALFTTASGRNIRDTQTGLRGIPISLLPLMLNIKGERFEYEMKMLLEAGNLGYDFKQIYINTVYSTGNKSSHFNPIKDSFRVCVPFFKFCLSGITAAVIDYTLFFFFLWLIGSVLILPGSLLGAVIIARIISSSINYTMNKTLVFHSKASKQKPQTNILHYYTLVVCLMLLNYLMLKLFTVVFGFWLILSKVLTEFLLFFVSYGIQRFILFKNNPTSKRIFKKQTLKWQIKNNENVFYKDKYNKMLK